MCLTGCRALDRSPGCPHQPGLLFRESVSRITRPIADACRSGRIFRSTIIPIGELLPFCAIDTCLPECLLESVFRRKVAPPTTSALKFIQMREALEGKRSPVHDRHWPAVGHAAEIPKALRPSNPGRRLIEILVTATGPHPESHRARCRTSGPSILHRCRTSPAAASPSAPCMLLMRSLPRFFGPGSRPLVRHASPRPSLPGLLSHAALPHPSRRGARLITSLATTFLSKHLGPIL